MRHTIVDRLRTIRRQVTDIHAMFMRRRFDWKSRKINRQMNVKDVESFDQIVEEHSVRFGSRREWEAWKEHHPEILSSSYIKGIVNHALSQGVWSHYLSASVPASEVKVEGDNYRESLLVSGLSPRHRAVLDLLISWEAAKDTWNARIYAPEALTQFALTLRARYPRFVGSEYTEDSRVRERLFPIPWEDIANLSFPSGSLDCVVCNEVFEHIPDLDAALMEISRVLRVEGLLIGTFPFLRDQDHGLTKAALEGKKLRYFSEPEYHGNPVEPEKGSLVFEIPGWNILDRCTRAGFEFAELVFVSSKKRGITGADIAGVFVLWCIK